jgi:ribulose-5-phosphate 4-epimerase/fuculose-1-phosphate aldolase
MSVPFDENIWNLLLRYARMPVARGYVHHSLGNLAIRVPIKNSSTAWPTPSTLHREILP